jgi:hypothetical protein
VIQVIARTDVTSSCPELAVPSKILHVSQRSPGIQRKGDRCVGTTGAKRVEADEPAGHQKPYP